MFGWLKRTATEAVVRGTFDSTMKEVRSLPPAVQLEIAQHVLGEIKPVVTNNIPSSRAMLAQITLETARAQRQQAVAAGANDEGDPSYAKPALVESWCLAALTCGPEDVAYIGTQLSSWAAALPGVTSAAAPPPPPPAPRSAQPGPAGVGSAADHTPRDPRLPPPPRAATMKFDCPRCRQVVEVAPGFRCTYGRCPLERQ